MDASKYDNVFTVDESSDLPIWVQLRNRMSYLIRTGAIPEGEQLPSVRSLAAEASINYNTVTKAYRDLENERLIVNIRGRGMFVRKGASQGENPRTAAIDATVTGCIEQYKALGMTLDEIEQHLETIISEHREAIADIENEKAGYGND